MLRVGAARLSQRIARFALAPKRAPPVTRPLGERVLTAFRVTATLAVGLGAGLAGSVASAERSYLERFNRQQLKTFEDDVTACLLKLRPTREAFEEDFAVVQEYTESIKAGYSQAKKVLGILMDFADVIDVAAPESRKQMVASMDSLAQELGEVLRNQSAAYHELQRLFSSIHYNVDLPIKLSLKPLAIELNLFQALSMAKAAILSGRLEKAKSAMLKIADLVDEMNSKQDSSLDKLHLNNCIHHMQALTVHDGKELSPHLRRLLKLAVQFAREIVDAFERHAPSPPPAAAATAPCGTDPAFVWVDKDDLWMQCASGPAFKIKSVTKDV
eukprot:m.66258 g.66258  ORF g.66258 m.66258 type:complete len:329 (+) comp7389_c0_seq2:191-1177(+)